MSAITDDLAVILADTYALYLKTQNYHWHVKGPNFKTLHELFEGQYIELAMAADSIAERILMLGEHAPATFGEFERLKTIADGNSRNDSETMLKELCDDHRYLDKTITTALHAAQKSGDEGTVVLLGERLASHEKAAWMLNASRV